MHASTSIDKALLTLELLLQSWIELAQKPISNEDLLLAKAKFKGQIAHETQTSGQRAERKAQLRSLNLPDNYDYLTIKLIEEISADTLLEAAYKHLRTPLLSL